VQFIRNFWQNLQHCFRLGIFADSAGQTRRWSAHPYLF
jgi:hypothetical protein